jgi:hypothetical protein
VEISSSKLVGYAVFVAITVVENWPNRYGAQSDYFLISMLKRATQERIQQSAPLQNSRQL